VTESQYDSDLRVGFARLEGKVDAALMGHATRLDGQEARLQDHELRLRATESQLPKIESQIQTVGTRSVVTPKHIYSGIVLFLMGVGALVTVLNFLLR